MGVLSLEEQIAWAEKNKGRYIKLIPHNGCLCDFAFKYKKIVIEDGVVTLQGVNHYMDSNDIVNTREDYWWVAEGDNEWYIMEDSVATEGKS